MAAEASALATRAVTLAASETRGERAAVHPSADGQDTPQPAERGGGSDQAVGHDHGHGRSKVP